MKKIVLLLTLIALTFVIVGCADKKFIDNSINVYFAVNLGTSVEPYTNLSKGQKIAEPEEPTKLGNYFRGWYSDGEFTTKWDFDNDTVEKNTVLFALWEQVEFKIVYVMEGDDKFTDVNAIITKFTTQNNENLPKATRTGSTFEGWILTPQTEFRLGDKKYNKLTELPLFKSQHPKRDSEPSPDEIDTEESPLDEEEYIDTIYLYPFFKGKSIMVVLMPNVDGLLLGNITTYYGYLVDFLPEDLEKPGYEFIGWYRNDGTISGTWKVEVKNGDYVSFSDSIKLYARWEKIVE